MTRIYIVFAVISIYFVLGSARLLRERIHIPNQFTILEKTDPSQSLKFTIALKQYNIDRLEAVLLDVSDPDSVNYGNWWTSSQILDLVSPSIEEVEPVILWLKHHGVENIDLSGRDCITVKTTIDKIEKLFQTKMYDYKSSVSGVIYSRALGSVSIPDHLDVVEMITGLTELIPHSKKAPKTSRSKNRHVDQVTSPLGLLYPDHIRKLYQIPNAPFSVNPQSSLAIVAIRGEGSFYQFDVDSFNNYTNEHMKVSTFYGEVIPGSTTPYIEYGAIALNTSIWFWETENWLYDFAADLFNTDPYPLVVVLTDGYPEDWQCLILGCSSVLQSLNYTTRVNNEFLKIGLKGVTMVTGSGNLGALGQKDNTRCGNLISNQFPASSPWFTTAGATMLVADKLDFPLLENAEFLSSKLPPICKLLPPCATSTTEGVCTYPGAQITSGGGFSIVSSLPGWQKSVVLDYLKSDLTFPYGQFNASNRAYPDVALNGHKAFSYSDGFNEFDGSELSAVVFGSIVSLLNSHLLNNNKQPIGFANPMLYKMHSVDPKTFTDITEGNNYCSIDCCGHIGYSATKGWDAVTGLGTTVFPKMMEFIQKYIINKK